MDVIIEKRGVIQGLGWLWGNLAQETFSNIPCKPIPPTPQPLAHQNRTIPIASDPRVDRAKSPEIPQKEGVSGSEIAARNRKSLLSIAPLNRNAALLSVVSEIAAISGVRRLLRN